MKDLATKSKEEFKLGGKEIVSAAILHITMALLGFVASRGIIFENFMPFGLVILGGCTPVFLPSIATGAFIGYFIPAIGTGAFRYIAALFAVIAIRLLLSNYKKISQNPFFLSLVTVLANVFTGIVTYSGVPLEALKLAAESLIIFATVFLTHKTFVSLGRSRYGLSTDELACVLVTASIILIGLSNFTVFGISVGRTIGIFLILAAAKYGGITAGALCGIAVSFCAAVTGAFESGFGIYAFMGLAAGMFAVLGKYAQSVAGISAGIIGLSFMKFKDGSILFIVEIIISCVAFLLIPRTFGIFLSKFFYKQPKLTTDGGFNKALNLRLNLASDALMDVSDTVCQVSKELGKINAPDFKTVLAFIEQDACSGCKLRLHCWENKSEQTLSAVMQMINYVKGGDIPEAAADLDEFRGRCLRVKKMEDTITARYSEYASLLAAENRIEEVRQVVSEQFEGISDMLRELAIDFENDEQFNDLAASSAVSALKNLGINTDECAAKIDKYGRMSLEMKLKTDPDTILNRLQIMKMLSLACERDFDIPNITKTNDGALMTVNEHAVFRIDIGVDQHCAVPGSICGDSCKYFNDGKGHFIMVLSDGMGTGGRAAVDGAMASGLMARLLKAGLGYDCSLKILNSSMLFKSTDESLATVDIASIDLFTGNTELYKAGAAPTLVRRGGKSGRAESTSLPIGILKDVSFDRAGIRLRAGDILLLVSDGVTFDGTEWIRAELENWCDGGAQDLAEHICNCARRRRTEGKPDDITVMAAIIEKTA